MASLLPQVVAVLWSPMSRTNWWWAVQCKVKASAKGCATRWRADACGGYGRVMEVFCDVL